MKSVYDAFSWNSLVKLKGHLPYYLENKPPSKISPPPLWPRSQFASFFPLKIAPGPIWEVQPMRSRGLIWEGKNDVNSHSGGAYMRGFNQKKRENHTEVWLRSICEIPVYGVVIYLPYAHVRDLRHCLKPACQSLGCVASFSKSYIKTDKITSILNRPADLLLMPLPWTSSTNPLLTSSALIIQLTPVFINYPSSNKSMTCLTVCVINSP